MEVDFDVGPFGLLWSVLEGSSGNLFYLHLSLSVGSHEFGRAYFR